MFRPHMTTKYLVIVYNASLENPVCTVQKQKSAVSSALLNKSGRSEADGVSDMAQWLAGWPALLSIQLVVIVGVCRPKAVSKR